VIQALILDRSPIQDFCRAWTRASCHRSYVRVRIRPRPDSSGETRAIAYRPKPASSRLACHRCLWLLVRPICNGRTCAGTSLGLQTWQQPMIVRGGRSSGIGSRGTRISSLTTWWFVYRPLQKTFCLDDALIRPGRVDMKIKFDLASSSMIMSLFYSVFATLEEGIWPLKIDRRRRWIWDLRSRASTIRPTMKSRIRDTGGGLIDSHRNLQI